MSTEPGLMSRTEAPSPLAMTVAPSANRFMYRVAMIATLLAVAMAVMSCEKVPFQSRADDCHPLKEFTGDTEDLISGERAEEIARSRFLGRRLDNVPREDITVCLSTHGSYENELNPRGGRVNPEHLPRAAPVWVMEFRNVSWYDDSEWKFSVTIVVNAVNRSLISWTYPRGAPP